VHLPVSITLEMSGAKTEQVGFVRDISSNGIFFYSSWRPSEGEEIDFVLNCRTRAGKRIGVRLRGRVCRIEQNVAGSACGIAVQFHSSFDAAALLRSLRE
jgi:hypothetical protein